MAEQIRKREKQFWSFIFPFLRAHLPCFGRAEWVRYYYSFLCRWFMAWCLGGNIFSHGWFRSPPPPFRLSCTQHRECSTEGVVVFLDPRTTTRKFKVSTSSSVVAHNDTSRHRRLSRFFLKWKNYGTSSTSVTQGEHKKTSFFLSDLIGNSPRVGFLSPPPPFVLERRPTSTFPSNLQRKRNFFSFSIFSRCTFL